MALLTHMHEPLASVAGNAVEVQRAIDQLSGAHRDSRLHEVVIARGAEMLMAGRLASDHADARRKMERALASGAAAEKFAAMVHALGGSHDVLDRSDAHLAPAPCIGEVEAPIDGFISAIDTRALGLAVVMLGGGRSVPGAAVDPAVGLSDLAGIGDEVGRHRPLCRIHARSEADAEEASAVVQQGYSIGDKPPERRSPIIDRIVAAQ